MQNTIVAFTTIIVAMSHGSYNLNRNNNGYQPYNRQDSRVNYGNNYDSGRRGTGAFSQPQRDSRSNMGVRPENSNQESSRQVNGTTIVGGRR